ncbi:neck protein [Mycobacterium phage Aminay]|uniref:Head-to-tail connector protein n=1 Tax=Mycobacterium phage Aminay TaxID=2250291 RepID=A0A345KV00_9CAUD|nr:neck protein [Mycobacterium phage Aminay]AXH46852.1 hypothetical protein SEA_AMINAY_14 [Mycobacterium phage Aminay]
MGRLDIPFSEHDKIRKAAGVQAKLRSMAGTIASRAGLVAGAPGGYGTDMTVGTDRARAHVWPETSKANRAEVKSAPLLQISAEGK